MHKKFYLTVFTLLLLSFSLKSQLSLVFPKNNYVFDSTTVLFEWNAVPAANTYEIQLATDINFSNLVVNQSGIINTNYTASNLPSNQQFYWRCKSDNSAWSTVRSFRIVDFTTWPTLELWLDADSVTPIAGNKVAQWNDLSGNSNHLTQTNSGNQPTLENNVSGLNGHNQIDFDALSTQYLENLDLSNLVEGDIFALLKLNTSFPSSPVSTGLWTFGSSTLSDHYPYTNSSVYSGFGNNTRHQISTILPSFDLSSVHILNINSGSDFNLRLNNDLFFNTSTGYSSFSSSILLGKSYGNYFFDGKMSEVLLFNTVLSDSLRNLVHSQMQHKYAPPVNLGSNITQYGFCDTTLYAGKRFTSYLWSDGSTADSLIANGPGTYWVEVEDIFGFISRDTIEVLSGLNYPTSQLYCPSEFIDWQTGLGEHYNYLWSDGSTADSLVINSPGSYHVTVTDTNGCVFKSDTLSFQEDVFPTSASLGPDLNLCSGNNLSLTSGASEAVSYLWNTGSTEASILIENSGTYSVEVININGCVAKDTVDVTIIGDAPVLAIDFPQYACLNTVFSFEDESSTVDGSILTSWTWEMGDGNMFTSPTATHSYNEGGSYEVNYAIGTSSGCFMDTTFTVEVRNNPILTLSSNGACQNSSIEFYGGQLTPFTISDWRWDFGDNTPQVSGQNVTHEFTSHGEFEEIG